jgi:sec-independent protein translocase protein TatA
MAPGPLQIILIILVIILVFGAGRVPGIMENLAKGITSFKKGLKAEDKDSESKTLPRSETKENKDDAEKNG